MDPSGTLAGLYGFGHKDMQQEADRARVLYGMELGATAESAAEGEVEDGVGVRIVPPNNRVSHRRRRSRPLNTHCSDFVSRFSIQRKSYVHSERSGWILVSRHIACII